MTEAEAEAAGTAGTMEISEQNGLEPGPAESTKARLSRTLRASPRVLSRPGAHNTVRGRLDQLLTQVSQVSEAAQVSRTGDIGGQDDQNARDGQDPYGLDERVDLYGDGVVRRLEERVAGLLGTEAAAFFPTGTMAQQVALRCWAARTGNPTVALHPLAHPELHERGAFGTVSGLRTIHATRRPRLPDPEEIHALEEPFGTLMLELPLREAGFVLPTWEELTATVEAAREREAVVHFDGARLWESATHFGRPLSEIAALADSVYVSFYKSLEGFGGAALAGPQSLIEEATAWRHRYGGQIFQQFPTALSALVGLDRELPRLPSYVAQARVVAEAVRAGFGRSDPGWWRVHPGVPHTHQFKVWLPWPPELLDEVSLAMAEETGTALFSGWHTTVTDPPGIAATEVTLGAPGLEWTAAQVESAAAEFVTRARERGKQGGGPAR
ncbi:threonine aldolase family protein [Streptomyces physcomitrii]|nr:beta-eliminating lyase-related protein [Streptomyces physcomitrii]